MTELLKFICRAPGCGKKFCTQNRLEIHIKSKHPELFSLLSSPNSTDLNFNKNPIENIINTQKGKIKSNILQPIKKKNILQNKEEDNIIERLNIKYNINCLKTDTAFENVKVNTKNSINTINEINEITDDLIFVGENEIYEDYSEIINLDLSNKNINTFQSNKNIPFEFFTKLNQLNISYNNICTANDLKYFINIKILIINNNKIKDISFCLNLPNLEQFNAKSNEIISIENLSKCNKLKILDISNNKIDNIINTLKIFKKLKTLEQLKIKDNPFTIKLFAYKHYFIYKYQNLLVIDGEEINEIDKDISGRFIRENISMYDNIKELNDNNLNNNLEEDNINNDIDNDNNNIIYKIGNTIISKEMHIPYKSKNKNNHKENKNNNDNIIKNDNININKDNNNTNIDEIKKENIKLKETIEEQKKEIDNLKLELENSNLIIKDYESIIDQYKLKYGDINDDDGGENIYNNNININKINNININTQNTQNEDKKDKEIKSLKKDLEMWKKEYFDLLYNKMNKEKNNNNKNNNIKRNNDIELFNDEILKIEKEIENEENIGKIDNINLKKIERPKTAVSRYDNPLKEFENIYKEISIMKSRNTFADVLEENTDEEEENEDEIKNKSDSINNMKEYKNKINIKNENNKNEEMNNNKILKPLIIKDKKY